ncbi:MAG: hypothetical protein QOJ69_63 [Actinomycetota bacterium]|nr:hypothetical protein [Actinomycetota bacterium]MEA2842392.1 hypothetical protein [Actinomycetota bacterium]
MSRRILTLLAVVAVAGAIAGCGTSKSTDDAKVTTCVADPGGGQPTATGTVLNSSSETSTFVLKIGFYDTSDNRVSDAVVNVGDVEANQTGQWQTTGLTSAKGPLTCKVTSLNRTSLVNS